MFSFRILFFVALAIACAFADQKVKKDVLLGTAGVPIAYSGLHSAAYVPTAYSAYGAYPAAVPAYTGYSAYGAYPYAAGVYRGLYY